MKKIPFSKMSIQTFHFGFSVMIPPQLTKQKLTKLLSSIKTFSIVAFQTYSLFHFTSNLPYYYLKNIGKIDNIILNITSALRMECFTCNLLQIMIYLQQKALKISKNAQKSALQILIILLNLSIQDVDPGIILSPKQILHILLILMSVEVVSVQFQLLLVRLKIVQT